MSEDSRNKILNRLKNTKTREEETPSSSGFNFLKNYNQDLLKTFEEKFKTVNGQFVYCKNQNDFLVQLNRLILDKNVKNICCIESEIANIIAPYITVQSKIESNIEAAITSCEYIVAQTGSAILSTQQVKSRQIFAYPPIHIIIAHKNQVVNQLDEGLNLLAEKYKDNIPSQITTITGPSRTADIEKTLVLGAHGPKELIIFYIDVEL